MTNLIPTTIYNPKYQLWVLFQSGNRIWYQNTCQPFACAYNSGICQVYSILLLFDKNFSFATGGWWFYQTILATSINTKMTTTSQDQLINLNYNGVNSFHSRFLYLKAKCVAFLIFHFFIHFICNSFQTILSPLT